MDTLPFHASAPRRHPPETVFKGLFKGEQTFDRVAATLSIDTNASRRDHLMNTNTLLIIVVLLLLLGGGGFYFR
jgi:hypothetical protein